MERNKSLTPAQRERLQRVAKEQEALRAKADALRAKANRIGNQIVLRLVRQGVAVPEIAEELGLTRQAIYERIWTAERESESE